MLQEKVISITTFEGNLMMTIEVWQTILVTEMVMYQILNRCIRKTTQLYVACICAIFPHFCIDVIVKMYIYTPIFVKPGFHHSILRSPVLKIGISYFTTTTCDGQFIAN